MFKNIQIIAEVKTQSPFKPSTHISTGRTWEELFALAQSVGDIISIHTDARWGGSFDLFKKARGLTSKPLLAKGIHSADKEIERAFEIGADYVLVVGRVPKISADKLLRCLIEPLSLENFKKILDEVEALEKDSGMKIRENLKIVWNSRDLKDGSLKTETFEEARALFRGWICQASNIKTVDDIYPDTDAVLVGTHLVEFIESLKK